ncbi:MAG: hypothetical protein ABI376_02240, partial [Caulobacteraceae bacterium]
MSPKVTLAGAVAVILAAASGPAHAGFAFQTLVFPRADSIEIHAAVAINDLGQVVVEGTRPNIDYSFITRTGIYSLATHAFTPFAPYPGSFPDATRLTGINNLGQLVGYYHQPFGQWRGFSYAGGAFTPRNAFGGSFNTPQAINDLGVIVGAAGDANQTQGYIYRGGTYTPVNAAPNPLNSTGLLGINDRGQIVGVWGNSASGQYPNSFLDVGGVFTPIAMPGQRRTAVAAINNFGLVVGGVSNDDFVTGSGFAWANGVFFRLDYPGAKDTYALGVNDRGQIVGFYTDQAGVSNAFLATLTTLTTL